MLTMRAGNEIGEIFLFSPSQIFSYMVCVGHVRKSIHVAGHDNYYYSMQPNTLKMSKKNT